MLDRSVAPQVSFNPKISGLDYQTHLLSSSSIPVYGINDTNHEVVGVQIVYSGSKLTESVKGASYFSTHLLKSGTEEFDAHYINDFFELRGAFVQMQNGPDNSTFSLYCLSEKLEEVLPFFLRLFNESNFPEKQVDKLKKKKIQEININQQKSNYWANKLLKQSLFGDHPYGHVLSLDDVSAINRESIRDQWERRSSKSIEFITITGKYNKAMTLDAFEDSLNRHIDKSPSKQKLNFTPSNQEKKLDSGEQTSLKIGLPTINLLHLDYPALSLANTIWGGYFGSRLMQTIREEKGLTYGIRSSFIHLHNASYIQISADLKKGAGEETIALIKSELELLVNKGVNETELDKVKNFVVGEYKSGTESIFDKMSKVKFLKTHQLSDSYFQKLYNEVLKTDSQKIRKVVEQYIQPDIFHTVIVE